MKLSENYQSEHKSTHDAFGISNERAEVLDGALNDAVHEVVNEFGQMEIKETKVIDIFKEVSNRFDKSGIDLAPNELQYLTFSLGALNDGICMAIRFQQFKSNHPLFSFLHKEGAMN